MRIECRLGGPVTEVLDLGDLAVTGFKKDAGNWAKAPLKLLLGEKSGLLQLDRPPDPEMYREYWYRSGTNEAMREALKNVVYNTLPHFRNETSFLTPLWLDIACNDGTLLSFVPNGFHKVGFDPARNLETTGLDIFVNDFFSAEAYSGRIGSQLASVITSIAVFYDLDDPRDFVRQVKACLAPGGVWVIQMSYLPLMLQQNAFDNICHEHVTYWTLGCLRRLLNSESLEVVDVELNDVNGGSFRVYVRHFADTKAGANAHLRMVREARVKSLLMWERHLDLDKPETWLDWAKHVHVLRAQTQNFLYKLKNDGKTVLGYGASTKGNTLLQWYGIGPDLLPAIADRQEGKVGLRCAGTDIPVISEEEMRECKPDYLFVLPWHFIDGFRQREKEFLNRGGKFIVPLPSLEVVG